jgi:glycosyltransferase involved in cell wall biosynthesis
MRIGIDAKWFYSGNPSGRVWIRNVLEQLIRNYPDNEYIVFLKASERRKLFPYTADNVKLVFLPIENNLLANLFLIPFVAKDYNIDIIITQYFASPFCPKKQITIVHDILFKSNPQYFGFIERAYFTPIKPFLRFSDGVITVSKYTKYEMGRYGFISKCKLSYVIYNGVNRKFFDQTEHHENKISFLKEKYDLPEKYILYVGRLNQRKNIGTLIRALQKIEDKTIKLVLCGKKDWKMFDIDKLIRETKLENRIIQLGYIEDDDLPLLYRGANLFAYVSYCEGFGLPPLEAMASGTPVVVSDRASLPEVCGDAAEYVNPFSVDDIARGLNKVLSNQNLRKELIIKGRRRAKKFTWEEAAKVLLMYINQICNR